jgi:hypothetical protein
VGHKAFADLVEKGPSQSRFSSWFHIGARKTDYRGWITTKRGEGFAYDCWEGHPDLPRLDLSNKEVK